MGRKTVLPRSPVRKLMKEAGGEIVSDAALDFLVEHLEAYARELSKGALRLTKHSKRKKLTDKDLKEILKVKKEEKVSVV